MVVGCVGVGVVVTFVVVGVVFVVGVCIFLVDVLAYALIIHSTRTNFVKCLSARRCITNNDVSVFAMGWLFSVKLLPLIQISGNKS